ncbi:hypothetical protein OHV13_01210 [Kitasatospora purpeofusca]|uniref:hypothetical protein n=1 Tax=Kitasatospora purpeofusca TaxID=67352 RepID=UPI003247838B
MDSGTDMMALRRSALDALSDLSPTQPPTEPPFAGIEIVLGDGLPAPRHPEDVGTDLVCRTADLLVRDGPLAGPGAALISGVPRGFTLEQARIFHQALFRRVWEEFRERTGREGTEENYPIKAGTISDGAIPLELYGSRWSFKRFHIDRDALIFSHLYGPVTGFTGGELQLIDVRRYLIRHSLSFDDAFEWSDEPTDGSKPVLHADHCEHALAEWGATIGALGTDQIVFVNNVPDAGVLHGITPLVTTDPEGFHREYHRCSVKDLRLC